MTVMATELDEKAVCFVFGSPRVLKGNDRNYREEGVGADIMMCSFSGDVYDSARGEGKVVFECSNYAMECSVGNIRACLYCVRGN